jgi:hypothetical protein
MMDENTIRAFANELVSYACGRWTGGRSEDDPVYQQVTEGRDVGAARRTYSSCADLAHWLLYRLGSRVDFINRKEHNGWKVGVNVSALAFSPVAEVATETDQYQAGDVLVIWSKPDGTDAHVMIALEHSGSTLVTGEYGQPGGAVREHHLAQPLLVGRRKIHRVLRLQRVCQVSEQQHKLNEPDYTTLPLAQVYVSEHAPRRGMAANPSEPVEATEFEPSPKQPVHSG